MLTICALATLVASFWCGVELSNKALAELDDRDRSFGDILKHIGADAMLFLFCAAGVVTALYALVNLWVFG